MSALSARTDVSVCAYALTWRGRQHLTDRVPPGVDATTRPIPARVVRELWGRGATRPRAEDWTGPVDVVHSTNYVAPPAQAPVVVTVHDLHASLLHALGLDHRRLSQQHEGRATSLTDADVTKAKIVPELFA